MNNNTTSILDNRFMPFLLVYVYVFLLLLAVSPGFNSPPDIPNIAVSFQVTVEANILDKKTTMVAREYYDATKNRAALRTFSNNTEQYMIFDYANNQVIYDLSNGNGFSK